MSKLLSKNDLLKQDDLKIEKVELSRGHVFIREMTGYERSVFEQAVMVRSNYGGKTGGYELSLDNFYAKLAVSTLCDENGELLFTMKEALNFSKQISAVNLTRIVEKAQEINAITPEDRDAILKNSEAVQEEGLTSSSADN